MKIEIPILIQDQMVAVGKGMEPTEMVKIEEAFFLDGPVSKRVAVLDFDDHGGLKSGVRFLPSTDDDPGTYDVPPFEMQSDAFIQVNVFGTVYATMAMFEEADALGRRLTWAFNAPQLLVVPRAGKWANAYYERDSHSLQFFYFPSARADFKGQTVHTGLARDIIAHETGHAVLDGIAPDLYNAITPQSLALHEAIADLTALMMSMRSRKLVEKVLELTQGSIERSTAFSAIAEEFGVQQAEVGPFRPLRSLLNDKVLPDQGARGRTSPHALSEVLTGALYKVMVKMHTYHRKAIAKAHQQSEYSSSGRALFIVREHFKRMIFRALDYLPPGEVSFADYGRAIIAADLASHPQWPRERAWIAEEFVTRKIVPTPEHLLQPGASEHELEALNRALKNTDLDTLVESDWAAYDFATRMQDELRIPQGKPFWVRPRLKVKKKYRAEGSGWKEVQECIFKVSWDHEEENPHRLGLSPRRQITVGTMLAIHWPETEEGYATVRALLTSDFGEEHRHDRDAMLRRMLDDDRLKVGSEGVGPDGKPLHSSVLAEVSGDLLRVRNSARMLHIDGLGDNEEAG